MACKAQCQTNRTHIVSKNCQRQVCAYRHHFPDIKYIIITQCINHPVSFIKVFMLLNDFSFPILEILKGKLIL